ncbi:hypothetical protein QWZ06_06735 [Chryseobacterium tructae]|uniref:DUF4294 domain-containing protein n=1 Tax=Chryseobacterium tructae TaxID=1037380 RepID=A0ABV7XX68_9FLAO|nr:hypothetical protein [Chryseobacterium tructae]MDN3691969.1 hypothetical protein [Chryseobacterium tructae]
MKQLFFILLFFSIGIQAQIKKQKPGKVNRVENKLYSKSNKKPQYGTKNLKDEQVKRIINLSQQKDRPKNEIVKKNTDDEKGTVIYEETSFIRYKMLFIGLETNKDAFSEDKRLVLRDI